MWKRTSGKKKARNSRAGKGRSNKSRISVARLIVVCSLLGFFLFTLGAVGYVIFFRTVLA